MGLGMVQSPCKMRDLRLGAGAQTLAWPSGAVGIVPPHTLCAFFGVYFLGQGWKAAARLVSMVPLVPAIQH